MATVISCYRRIVDAYYKNKLDQELLDKEIKILKRVANRESSSHFFNKKATYRDQYYIDREEVSNQDFLGIVKDYDKESKLLTLEQRNYFKVGDEVTLFGPGSFEDSFKIKAIYDEDLNPIDCARHPQQIIKIKYNKNVPLNSMMRINIFK